MKVYILYEDSTVYDEKITHGVFSSIDKAIEFIKDKEATLFNLNQGDISIQDNYIRLKDNSLLNYWFYIDIVEVDNTNYNVCREEIEEIEKRLKQDLKRSSSYESIYTL